jgi:hypothetical protein
MRSAIILTIVVAFALLAVPLSSASVIHATINTKTNEGTVNATSNYVLYYTYPENSTTSQQLNGTVIWVNATSYLNSSGRQSLEGDMNEYDSQDQSASDSSNNSTSNNTTVAQPAVHVVNATLTYHLHAFANQTNLTVYRNLTLDLKISNITKKTGNNSTVIDMSWRAFGVQGELMSSFKGNMMVSVPSYNLTYQSSINTNMDVNLLGDLNLGGDGEGEDGGHGGIMMGLLFANDHFGTNVMNYETINFHVFSVPLTDWTRVYNSATNSTTFYYNSSTNFSLNASYSNNGENYTVKVKTDPAAAITTNGNAMPTSANELVVSGSAQSNGMLSAYGLPIVGAVIAVLIVGLVAVFARKRSKKL